MDRLRQVRIQTFWSAPSLSLLNITRQGFMYEKYNAAKPGEGGGGGEYEPQAWGVKSWHVLTCLDREVSVEMA